MRQYRRRAHTQRYWMSPPCASFCCLFHDRIVARRLCPQQIRQCRVSRTDAVSNASDMFVSYSSPSTPSTLPSHSSTLSRCGSYFWGCLDICASMHKSALSAIVPISASSDVFILSHAPALRNNSHYFSGSDLMFP